MALRSISISTAHVFLGRICKTDCSMQIRVIHVSTLHREITFVASKCEFTHNVLHGRTQFRCYKVLCSIEIVFDRAKHMGDSHFDTTNVISLCSVETEQYTTGVRNSFTSHLSGSTRTRYSAFHNTTAHYSQGKRKSGDSNSNTNPSNLQEFEPRPFQSESNNENIQKLEIASICLLRNNLIIDEKRDHYEMVESARTIYFGCKLEHWLKNALQHHQMRAPSSSLCRGTESAVCTRLLGICMLSVGVRCSVLFVGRIDWLHVKSARRWIGDEDERRYQGGEGCYVKWKKESKTYQYQKYRVSRERRAKLEIRTECKSTKKGCESHIRILRGKR
ncbi:hypothetical protein ACFE04_016263 [Oxalis oulophora]